MNHDNDVRTSNRDFLQREENRFSRNFVLENPHCRPVGFLDKCMATEEGRKDFYLKVSVYFSKTFVANWYYCVRTCRVRICACGGVQANFRENQKSNRTHKYTMSSRRTLRHLQYHTIYLWPCLLFRRTVVWFLRVQTREHSPRFLRVLCNVTIASVRTADREAADNFK